MEIKVKNEMTSIRTVGAFLNGRACSDTLFHVLNRAFHHPFKGEERTAMPFAGGIMRHGYQCGMIWGATLAAGAQAYRLFGAGHQAQARAVIAAQRLVAAFRISNHNINCLDITHTDKSSSSLQMVLYFLIKGGSIHCCHAAAKYAPVAFSEINAVFSQEPAETPCAPVSCAAMMARMMGASDMHTVMVAGFAGGIGLCGGACGALGAAIWITVMNSIREGDGKIDFKHPGAVDAIDRFMKCTGYEFECSEIVGRRFGNIEDHSGYLRRGGCSKIMAALAHQPKAA